ncbi:MAG: hypothetical protein JXR03_14780 [Cyclobacteriaceae bacterium]
MKPETISSIKKELRQKNIAELEEMCLRMAKYKVENKELLSFILFYNHDIAGYLTRVKDEVDVLFEGINSANLYWAKKSIRKIVRFLNKHIKYVASKEAEAELLIYFCQKMKGSKIPFQKSVTLFNLYERQIFKIEKAISTLHEDLQYDWNNEMDEKKLRIEYFN